MKTHCVEQTTNELLDQVIKESSLTECAFKTEELETTVHAHAYCSQMCQHSTAMDVEYVMIGFSLHIYS